MMVWKLGFQTEKNNLRKLFFDTSFCSLKLNLSLVWSDKKLPVHILQNIEYLSIKYIDESLNHILINIDFLSKSAIDFRFKENCWVFRVSSFVTKFMNRIILDFSH